MTNFLFNYHELLSFPEKEAKKGGGSPKDEYEKMKVQIAMLRGLEKIDFDLLRQFKASLGDVKAGRIRRVA